MKAAIVPSIKSKWVIEEVPNNLVYSVSLIDI
jgi:hypothetical protein